VMMLMLWLILTGGELKTWWFGLPSAGIVAVISTRLQKTAHRWSVKGLLRFVPFFVLQSLEGGFDVARRALHPRMPLEPVMVSYSVRLPEGPASVFLGAVISLLPGTLTAEMKDGFLFVHVLDAGLPAAQKLQILEQRVGGLFGIEVRNEEE
jgi:multicomponent Na+:H+ antiporter subunit E